MGHHNYSEHGHNDHSFNGYNAYYGHQRHQSNNVHNKWLMILDRVRGNQKLKFIIITVGIVILAIVILLIALFLPLIIKLFNYIMQNGIQGAWDAVTGFVEKLWTGSK